MIGRTWTGFVAGRWFRAGADSGPSLGPAAAGIGVGVAALIVILGVMNGFQMGFIDAVLELDSYHVRLYEREAGQDAAAIASTIPGVAAVIPFRDVRTLAVNRQGRTEAIRIKIVPDDALILDPSLANLPFRSGAFGDRGGLSVGSELARRLNLVVGDRLSVLAVRADEERGVETGMVDLVVTGVFHSGYYDFDISLAFLPESGAGILAEGENRIVGVKLKDRYDDVRALGWLSGAGIPQGAAESWRSYNRAFFGALRMEKNVMMALVGLIFIVVGVNIFHAMRKAVFIRMEEIAVLKAVGGGNASVRRIFLLNGLVAGTGGAFLGLCAGLLLTVNVNGVFTGMEAVFGFLSSLMGDGPGFRFFSPDLFYIGDVPVRIFFTEAAFITLAGASSALVAAWAASARLTSFMPSEVLRNE
ncbi:MAG: ABC transporter permease [Spirochaetales bacterium]|nr:MAG: ABC transporter permease [Spirochaetales bacterium]